MAHDLFVDMVIFHPTLCQELKVDNNPHIKEIKMHV